MQIFPKSSKAKLEEAIKEQYFDDKISTLESQRNSGYFIMVITLILDAFVFTKGNLILGMD